ncbi:hypothetical protein [Streptomyces sp. SAS_276]|uniref:hypothetical protein n=1 Tax=Streptomyces sp. SAS_276 TaxID=3412745 RepID=UPI00403CAE76
MKAFNNINYRCPKARSRPVGANDHITLSLAGHDTVAKKHATEISWALAEARH